MTSYIKTKGENQTLSLQDLSHKLAMLMALTRPSRSADLAKLDLSRRSYSVDGVTFLPIALSKQSSQQKHGTELYFGSPIVPSCDTKGVRGPHTVSPRHTHSLSQLSFVTTIATVWECCHTCGYDSSLMYTKHV